MALFARWDWITEEEFRKVFGYDDASSTSLYPRPKVVGSIRYGCSRVDMECGGAITNILGDKEFPHGLTKKQSDTVLEIAAWCANQFLALGGNWTLGSASVSVGGSSVSQTNPDEPDYFPPHFRNKLSQVGLIKMQYAKSLPVEQYNRDPALSYRGEDEAFFP